LKIDQLESENDLESNYLLTVGIPVYNGERFIRQTLESLIDALSEITVGKVEILISDNCSTDKTSLIIEDYRNSGKLIISSFRNRQNQGYDKNIDLIVERARGKYVWFLGCGEIVKPKALKTILSRLEKDTYNYVLLNFDIFAEDEANQVPEKVFSPDSDQKLTSMNEVYGIGSGVAMAVSSNIVLKTAWMKVAECMLSEKGWCHIERINAILHANEFPSFFIATPCFTLYRENTGWWTTRQVYMNFVSYCRLIMKLRTMLRDTEYQKIESRIYPFAFANSILLAKSLGVRFDKSMIKAAARDFGNKISFWIVILPLFFIPSKVFSNALFVWTKKRAVFVLAQFRAFKRSFL